jgi:hypothetical protein
MANRDDTSKPRSGRDQTDARASTASKSEPSRPTRPDFPISSLLHSPLIQAVEAERAELLRAHSILKCLYEVLLYAEGEDATSWADSANVAARLVDESVTRLDVVRLKPMIEALTRSNPYEVPEEKLNIGLGGKDEVKDGDRVAYLS